MEARKFSVSPFLFSAKKNQIVQSVSNPGPINIQSMSNNGPISIHEKEVEKEVEVEIEVEVEVENEIEIEVKKRKEKIDKSIISLSLKTHGQRPADVCDTQTVFRNIF